MAVMHDHIAVKDGSKLSDKSPKIQRVQLTDNAKLTAQMYAWYTAFKTNMMQ